ncbi:MAG: PepSY domain-containing protein [Lysobacter sp.]
MKFVAAHRPAPRLVAIVLLATVAAGAGGAMAQGRDQRDQNERSGRNDQARHADHRALADAVRRVERATGGEVLSAERVQSDGRDVSRVKVVDASGRVRVYMGDPPPRERKDDRTRRDDSNKD